jgi:hypothetical protein
VLATAVQNLLFSNLLPNNLKIRIYKTIILPPFLRGCEIWSLTFGEEQTEGPVSIWAKETGSDRRLRNAT